MAKVYGYIRVSTQEQNEARQKIAMYKQGITDKDIFMDKQSGKDFKRPAYQRMVRLMKKDDLLYIKSIDRLGRNYEEILEQWSLLTKEKEIDIVVLDMPLLDTRRGKDLMGTFISDIVLQILSFVAENERSNIRQRQAEGIAAAKERGVRFGRPSDPLPDNFHENFYLWQSGEITATAAAKACEMPLSTFRYQAKACQNDMKGQTEAGQIPAKAGQGPDKVRQRQGLTDAAGQRLLSQTRKGKAGQKPDEARQSRAEAGKGQTRKGKAGQKPNGVRQSRTRPGKGSAKPKKPGKSKE